MKSALQVPVVFYLLLLLASQYSLALKCYTGDSQAFGVREAEVPPGGDQVCARYDFPCWPGNIDPVCKQINPKNLTYVTAYTVLQASLCTKLTPPTYNNPLCCKEDLCNAPVVENPNPTASPIAKRNPPAAPPTENNNILYYVLGGVIVAFLAIGLIIFAIIKKRNVTDSLAKRPEEQQTLLQKDYDDINEIDVLGRGSGSVVVVVKQNGQKKWALKMTSNSADAREELRILTQLNHINILKVVSSPDLNAESKSAGLPLELCDCPLAAKLKDASSPLTDAEVYDYILQLGSALAYLFDTSNQKPLVLHCDIKPQNILLLKQDAKTILKLGDFGLAKLLDKEDGYAYDTSDKVIHPNIWTPHEVVTEKKYSISTDLFSFGVVCGQILLRNMDLNMDAFKEAIEEIATNMQSDDKKKFVAKFCLKVIGEQDKRPKGGDAKTKLVNFIKTLAVRCNTHDQYDRTSGRETSPVIDRSLN